MNDSEKYIIGYLMAPETDNHRILSRVKKEYFSTRTGQILFEYAASLGSTGEKVDSAELYRIAKLTHNHITPLEIADCMDAFVSEATAESNIRVVVKQGILSLTRQKLIELEETEHDPVSLHSSLVKFTDGVFENMETNCIQDNPFEIARKEFEENISDKNAGGIPYGIESIDSRMRGIKPANYVIIGAVTSVGKTAFACNMAYRQMIRHDLSVLYVFLEMTNYAMSLRFVSAHTGIPAQSILNNTFPKGQTQAIRDSYEVFKKKKFYTISGNVPDVNELVKKIKNFILKTKVDIIYVDYLQLLAERERGEARREAVQRSSLALQKLAQSTRIPVVSLVQLLNDSENREDGRPRISDIRESKSIAHDADVVMLLWRPPSFMTNGELSNEAKVFVDKNRNGQPFTLDLHFEPSTMSFHPIQNWRG